MARLGTGGDVSVTIEALNNARAGIDSAVRDLNRLGNKSQSTASKMRTAYARATKSLFSLKNAIAAVAAVKVFKDIFNAAADIEEGYIGVAKTTGLAGAEMKKFEGQIETLSVTMKGIKLKEFQSIAEIAGQLGIQGRDNLVEFTRVVGMMKVATNLTAESASENFAQISNIMKEPIANLERMGSVMNELSNTTTATASDIADLTKRMGGAAKTLGLTTPEVMGISATLKDMGINLEVGGTAMSQVFQKMLTNTEDFAAASGVSLEAYRKMIINNPVEALKALLTNLSQMDNFAQSEAIKNLGLEGVRTAGTLMKMSGGLEKLNTNLDVANTEWGRGTSLQIEYQTASKGTRAQMDSLGNQFSIFAKRVGETLLPAIQNILPWIGDALDAFVRFGEILGETAAKITLFVESASNSGRAFVENFVNGIKNAAAESYEAVAGWLGTLKGYFFHSPAETGPWAGWNPGESFVRSFAEGVANGQDEAVAAAEEMVAKIRTASAGGSTVEEQQAYVDALIQIEIDAARRRVAIEEELQGKLSNLRSSAANQFISLLSAIGQESEAAALAALAFQKGLAIAGVYVNTRAAAARALFELGPFAGPPMAASLIAWGDIQMALIAATGLAEAAFGGSVSASTSTVTSSTGDTSTITSTSTETTAPAQNVTFNIHSTGEVSDETIDLFVEALEKYTGKGAEVNVNVSG